MQNWRQSPGGERDVADVVLEVELGVLDPPRVVEVAGHPHHLLAERPGQVQAGLEPGEDALERHRPARCGRLVVDADRRDVGAARADAPSR